MLGNTIHDDDIDLPRTANRLPQRSRWQQPAVPEAPGSIDHNNLAIPREPQMLQAIICDYDVHSQRNELLRSGKTVPGDDRVTASQLPQKERFVADLAPAGLDMHNLRLA